MVGLGCKFYLWVCDAHRYWMCIPPIVDNRKGKYGLTNRAWKRRLAPPFQRSSVRETEMKLQSTAIALLITPCLIAAELGKISVEAVGEIITEPDTLEWSLVVNVRGDDLAELKRMNDVASANVYGVLEDAGIREELIVSPGIEFSRNERRRDGEPQYFVENRIAFVLTELERYPALVDKLVGIEHVFIEQMDFRTSKFDELAMDALDLALDSAREKADRIARRTGLRIVGVSEIREERIRSRGIMYANPPPGITQSRITVGKIQIARGVDITYTVEDLEPITPPNADKPRG